MVVSKGHKRKKPGTLNGRGELPLITGAGSGNAGGNELARFGDEVLQRIDIFVVDLLDLVCGKPTDPLSLKQGRLGGTTGFFLVKGFFSKSHA